MVCSGGLRQGLLIYVTKVQESRSGLFQHAVFEFSRSPVFFSGRVFAEALHATAASLKRSNDVLLAPESPVLVSVPFPVCGATKRLPFPL